MQCHKCNNESVSENRQCNGNACRTKLTDASRKAENCETHNVLLNTLLPGSSRHASLVETVYVSDKNWKRSGLPSTNICLWLSSVLFPKNRLGLEFRTSRSGSVEHPWSFQECPSTYSTVTTPVQPSAKVFNTEVVKLALNCKKKKKRCWSGCKQAVTLLHNSTGWNCTGQSCAVLCLFTCEMIVLYCCVGVLLPEHTGSHRSVPWLNDGVCANLGIRV